MARKLSKTARERKNFKRRLRNLERQGYIVDYEKASKATLPEIKKAYRNVLLKYTEGYALRPSIDDRTGEARTPQVVPTPVYREYQRARQQENRLRKQVGLQPLATTVTATSLKSFNRLLAGTKLRATKQYYIDRDNLFIENYIKTLATAEDQRAAELIWLKIMNSPQSWVVNKLRGAAEGFAPTEPAYFFDSAQGLGFQHMASILKFWEIDDYEAENEESFEDIFT